MNSIEISQMRIKINDVIAYTDYKIGKLKEDVEILKAGIRELEKYSEGDANRILLGMAIDILREFDNEQRTENHMPNLFGK